LKGSTFEGLFCNADLQFKGILLCVAAPCGRWLCSVFFVDGKKNVVVCSGWNCATRPKECLVTHETRLE